MSMFPTTIKTLTELSLNSQCANSHVLDLEPGRFSMTFAPSHLLHLVFDLLLLFSENFLGSTLFPSVSTATTWVQAIVASFWDSSNNLPVALPVSPCSVSHKCNLSCFPWSRTWIMNPMPILNTAYNPCPLKNSKLVFRVLPLSSQCGGTVSAPKVTCLSETILLLVPSLILLFHIPELPFYTVCYSLKIAFCTASFFPE